MKSRNAQMVKDRLLAACDAKIVGGGSGQAILITSLEDLIKTQQATKTEKRINAALPIKYGKPLNKTENTMATVHTNTSITVPSAVHLPSQRVVTPIEVKHQPARVVLHPMSPIQQMHSALTISQHNPHQSIQQQSLSSMGVKPITSSTSPALIRVNSPKREQQKIIEIKYSSPNIVRPANQALQNPQLTTKTSSIPQFLHLPIQERKIPEMRSPQLIQIEKINVVNTSNHLKHPSPTIVRQTESLKNIVQPSQLPQQYFITNNTVLPQTTTVEAEIIIQEQQEPRNKTIEKMQNPFEPVKPTKVNNPQSPSCILAGGTSERKTVPKVIQKGSINYLNSIYSSNFVKVDNDQKPIHKVSKEEKFKERPPKSKKRCSVAVGTSLHYQQIDQMQNKCKQYDRHIEEERIKLSLRFAEDKSGNNHGSISYINGSEYQQQHTNFNEVMSFKSRQKPSSMEWNSNNSTAVLSPFDLSQVLKEQQLNNNEDSMHFKELRMERILRKYRSKEDLFESYD